MHAVFDSDILVDYLQGLPAAAEELARYAARSISLVSWMEVMAGAGDTPEQTALCRRFLDGFEVLPITLPVAERAVFLRRTYRLKLPDAIIWASAQIHGCFLVTRNTKDFPRNSDGVRFPYRL